jgi:hypothetical protein
VEQRKAKGITLSSLRRTFLFYLIDKISKAFAFILLSFIKRRKLLKKSFLETFSRQNFRASINKATLNFIEYKYILYLVYYS